VSCRRYQGSWNYYEVRERRYLYRFPLQRLLALTPKAEILAIHSSMSEACLQKPVAPRTQHLHFMNVGNTNCVFGEGVYFVPLEKV